MIAFSTLRTVHLSLVLVCCLATAASAHRSVELIDRLQEHVARCQDVQYDVASYEREGNRQEERSYRFFVKGARMVRIQVLQGRGKGSEAVMDAQGRVQARKGGLLKPFARTLPLDDPRVRSLRGAPFWEAACPSFLKALRLRLIQPDSRCELAPDPAQPSLTLLTLHRPGGNEERYWIDPQGLHLLKGELFEGDLLVDRITIANIRENVGFTDSFFSF
jgi:outer membrane lipoprotein-sorting protein